MRRVLIPAGLAALVLLVWLLAFPRDTGPEGPGQDEGSASWIDEEEARLRRDRAKNAPVLKAAPGAAARAKRRAAAGDADDTEEETEWGPVEWLVLSSETEVPLKDVSILDGDGKEHGTTDKDGLLQVPQIPVEQGVYRAQREGYLPFRGVIKPDERMTVLLRPGMRVPGLVVRAGRRTPMARAGVRVWDDDLAVEIAAVETDKEGRFVLPAVRPNHPITVVVTAEGLVPHLAHYNFDAVPGEWVIEVGDGGSIEGKVLGPDGKTLENVEVRLVTADVAGAAAPPRGDAALRAKAEMARARTGVTRTDKAGHYAFRGAPIGPSLRPTAFVGARLRGWGKRVRFNKPGESVEIDVHVPKPATLRIHVKDDTGEALGHAKVNVVLNGERVELLPSDKFVDGAWVMEGLTFGEAWITAFLPGAPAPRARTRLAPGQTTNVTLQFASGRKVTGKVTDKHGAPIWRARVSWRDVSGLESAGARTDGDGKFVLRRLKGFKGTVTVTARDLQYTYRTYERFELKTVVPGGAPMKIVLRDGTRITGRFQDLPKGAEVQSEMLPGTEHDRLTLWLDKEARFSRRGAPVDKGALFVFRLPGFAPLFVDERRAPFSSEEVRDLGRLWFEETNPRKGRVHDSGGKRLPGVRVSIAEPWGRRSTRTDRKGEFAFARLPDEGVMLLFEALGLPPFRQALTTAAQFERQVFVLFRGAPVTVKVYRLGGLPGSGARVLVRQMQVGVRSRKAPPLLKLDRLASSDGQLKLDLPAGHFQVVALDPYTGENGRARLTVKGVGAKSLNVLMYPRKPRK